MRIAPPFRKTVATGVVALSMLAIAIDAALPQASAPSLGLQGQGSTPPAAPTPEPSPETPGLINEMGKLFKQIIPPMKSPGEAIDDLNARAKDTMKDAGDALSRLACAMVKEQDRRQAAGTDCKRRRLTRKGATTEGPALIAAETCSAKVMIPGRASPTTAAGTFVTTALCQ